MTDYPWAYSRSAQSTQQVPGQPSVLEKNKYQWINKSPGLFIC